MAIAYTVTTMVGVYTVKMNDFEKTVSQLPFEEREINMIKWIIDGLEHEEEFIDLAYMTNGWIIKKIV